MKKEFILISAIAAGSVFSTFGADNQTAASAAINAAADGKTSVEATKTEYSPEDYQVVYELFDIGGVKATHEAMLKESIEVQIRNNPVVFAPLRKVLTDFFNKYLNYEDIKKEYADLYLEYFTPAEIKELIAFYRTETGKKIARLQPTLGVRGAKIGENAVKKHLPELREAVRAAFNEKNKAVQNPASDVKK